MAADKKSNPAQIAQAVLDETNQSVKVSIVSGGGGGGGGGGGDVNLIQVAGTAVTTGTGNATAGTQRVVLASDQPTIPVDIQDTSIAVSLDYTEDSVTIFAPNNNTTAIPVSAASLPLPSGAATETTLSALNGKLNSLGQKTMANSAPIVIASDQSPIPITGSFSVTATNPSVSTTGTAVPGSATMIGGSDGTNLVAVKTDSSGNVQAAVISSALPTGAATEATLNSISTKTPPLGQATNANSSPVVISSNQTSAVPVARGSAGVITTPAQQTLYRTTFAASVPSGVDNTFMTVIQTGTGQTVSQTGGNLVITSGTTINSETIIRSNQSFTGSLVSRIQTILSQRIVNNNFFVELVDVIGDNLAVTVNSATSITVTIPNNPFTSANVGQSMYVGAVLNISGTAVPGRYAIASVAGNNVTFTVAGWPATGSGTCSLFGWNYYQLTYTAAVATAANYDAQRRGYASGVTALTINTTATPGHMVIMSNNDGAAYVSDLLVASATTAQSTQRGSRVVNLPEESTPLFLQLRSVNGTTAPASTTTWTVGTVSIENYSTSSVTINDVKAIGGGVPLPVSVSTGTLATVTTVTGVTTVSTVSTVTSVTSVTAANLAIPGTIADVASAALTTTTTTATLTPTFGISYQVNIPVTVVSGTTPTLDVGIEESDDTGTNWYRVYDFPRITATGIYRSPVLVLTGNRVRYVQTVGGTTPSFTRAVNRLQSSSANGSFIRQIYDRNISLTTLAATTSSLFTDGGNAAYLEINIGAVTTTAPALQLQGSQDGTNWISLGTPLTAVASSTVAATVLNVSYKFLRAIVTTAGVGVTAGYVLVKGFEQ